MMRLCNERLLVDIASPGTFYQGSRFDWSGFVTQVTLDSEHTFCASESLEEGIGSGGRGLCNEFGPFTPIGYDEAQIGEWFPKLGVGLLQRLDAGAYNFQLPYPIRPFPLYARSEGDNCLTFEFEPLLCRGYAARLKKSLSLSGSSLRIEYELENVGTRPLYTHEYNHNFLAVNGVSPGPDYILHLNEGLKLQGDANSVVRQDGHRLHWNTVPRRPGMICLADGPQRLAPGPVWQLHHVPSGGGMSESVDLPLERFTLWWAPHVLSPEVFVAIALAPNECLKWRREYRF